MHKHLMIDLETLATTPDAIVLSVGAIVFTPYEKLRERHWILSIEEQEKILCRRRDPSTEEWWSKQDPEAQRRVFGVPESERTLARDFADQFRMWIDPAEAKNIRVWGNGATFDVSIMENFYRMLGQTQPWKYSCVRCYRTVKAMHQIERGHAFTGLPHDALEDALFQAQCLSQFLFDNPEWDR